MAYKGSLFERLSSRRVEGANDEEAVIQSVVNNIRSILSSNAGSAEIADDYGKPDLHNVNLSQDESIRFIESRLEMSLNKYEPRLSNIRVFVDRDNPGPTDLSVFIEGALNMKGVAKKKAAFSANLFKNELVKAL
jgi:type VI secretion system protein